jgi:hypothetical protein
VEIWDEVSRESGADMEIFAVENETCGEDRWWRFMTGNFRFVVVGEICRWETKEIFMEKIEAELIGFELIWDCGWWVWRLSGEFGDLVVNLLNKTRVLSSSDEIAQCFFELNAFNSLRNSRKETNE